MSQEDKCTETLEGDKIGCIYSVMIKMATTTNVQETTEDRRRQKYRKNNPKLVQLSNLKFSAKVSRKRQVDTDFDRKYKAKEAARKRRYRAQRIAALLPSQVVGEPAESQEENSEMAASESLPPSQVVVEPAEKRAKRRFPARPDLNEAILEPDDLDDLEPYSYDPTYKGGNVSLDYAMDYSVICDESNGKKKAFCSDNLITPRLMYDISPNSQFNIVYELGDFWTNNEELVSMCADNLNVSWWSMPNEEQMETEEFISNHGVHSESAKAFFSTMSLSAMILMVIAVSVMALLRVCSSRGKKVEHLMGSPEDSSYGTI